MSGIHSSARIIAFDLETTGLRTATDRIVEVAAVCWAEGREVAAFQALVHPGRPIPPRVIAIHGITDAMVRDAPPVEAVLPEFFAFCAHADEVVAHNAPFDVAFLRAACVQTGMSYPLPEVTDSRLLARVRLPDAPNYRLETLKALLGRGHGQLHRALEDARDCLAVYLGCRQGAPATVRLPVPPLPEAYAPLRDTLQTGGTLFIEYQDTQGRVTAREIRPLLVTGAILEAYCFLRADKRRFTLDRIRRMWKEPS